GAEEQISISVKPDNGWYAMRVRLEDPARGELIDYRTSYTVLRPDTWKAGYESPFYGWWFQKNQHSDIKLEEVGPLLQRLGIRRAGLPEEMPERLTERYGFTNSTISFTLPLEGTVEPRKLMSNVRHGRMTLDEAIA